MLFFESATTSYARAEGLPAGYVTRVHLLVATSTCHVPAAVPHSETILSQSLPSTCWNAGSTIVRWASPNSDSGTGGLKVSIFSVLGSNLPTCICDMLPK